MNQIEIAKRIKMKGLELGFAKIGITSADDFTVYEKELRSRADYDVWINTKRGFLGKGSRPRSFYPEAKSIVCAVYSFAKTDFPEALTKHVARAYLSRSYVPLDESICGLRVNAFSDYLQSIGCNIYKGEIELPCRMACARAGLITYGKNNFAYTDEDGSFIILYTFLVDMELPCDTPTIACNCPPNCRLCIDACPTHAILRPGRLLPHSCILDNHMRNGDIPLDIRDGIGTAIHGCDICQVVCPRNKKVLARASVKDPFLEALKDDFDLERVLRLDEQYYKDVVYPIMYNYIRDIDLFRRNAAIALGNTGDASHIPALESAMESDNPLVKDAAAWAIGKLQGNEATK